MKLYYYKSLKGNFGDDMNAWLWNDLLPGIFDDDESAYFSGIGTIITTAMPASNNWTVFSSGAGYGFPPADFGGKNWNIISVRGPLSARVLNLPKECAITDGAALLNILPEFEPLSEDERKGVIFIPHHNALETGQWEKACELAGVEFISPENESKYVIQRIRSSKLVLADAMHAAIVADAMRVPWVPLVTSSQINTFKWLDWTQSINSNYSPLVLGSSTLLELFRDKTLKFYGENYYQPNANVDDAVKFFEYQRRIKSSKWWGRYSHWSKKITYKAPVRAISSAEFKFKTNWDQKLLHETTSKLEIAKMSNGFLSSDMIFTNNIERLQEGLISFRNSFTNK
ncbi:hypothetical protein [Sodalis sp. RH13]|uniref:hypothetical protein n=1 Tax=Sodalis sp. RH13 TaxID=3394328 RepID=UPI0039B38C49